MASTEPDQGFQQPSFILSPHQQDLLFAALNSNKNPVDQNQSLPFNDGLNGNLNYPLTVAPGSGSLGALDESPYIDYDYSFDDGQIGDFDFTGLTGVDGQMIGSLPGASSSDGDTTPALQDHLHDKRGYSDEGADSDEHDGKRREQDEKGAKKPGRKPLTSEPTSKRKAQNRAAQRAFRERKEKHLKDLETKVQDLEKASESANHENLILRAKVDKMAAELKEYKKRFAMVQDGTATQKIPSYLQNVANTAAPSDPNQINFNFDFPQFGVQSAPRQLSKSDSHVPQLKKGSSSGSFAISPTDKTGGSGSFSLASGMNMQSSSGMAQFSNIFTPSVDGSIRSGQDSSNKDSSRSSMDSSVASSANGNNTNHSSPASSASIHGPSSSCGTSPEPFSQCASLAQSPSSKLDITLPAICEETSKPCADGGCGGDGINDTNSFCAKLAQACGNPQNPIPLTMASKVGLDLPSSNVNASPSTATDSNMATTPAFDVHGIDWLAAQNNNAFDPQLFGDYREPQDNILSGGLYDDNFFTEAFAADFVTPFDMDPTGASLGVAPKKGNLLSEIDDKLKEDDEDEVVPGESEMLTCTNMWEKIQACPRVLNGQIDMDSLCTELQHKAKCSGEGPVIQEKDFKDVLNKMFESKGLPRCEDK
jgi:AP-1-like factor